MVWLNKLAQLIGFVRKKVEHTMVKEDATNKPSVSPQPQPAKQAAKRKPKAVQPTKVGVLSTLEQAVAQTRTEAQSGARGKRKTVASKTRQAASPVKTAKQKAAASTTAVKKLT